MSDWKAEGKSRHAAHIVRGEVHNFWEREES